MRGLALAQTLGKRDGMSVDPDPNPPCCVGLQARGIELLASREAMGNPETEG